MEFVNELFTGINDLFLYVATAIGALFMALRVLLAKLMIGLLGGLGRGAGTGLGSKITGSGGGNNSGNTGEMPSSPRYKKARQALYGASSRQARMANYVNAWFNLLAMRSGPHAVSVYLYSLMHPDFADKTARLRARCRKFDQLEEKAQRVLARYERDFEKKCAPLRDQLIDLDVEISRLKARYKRFGFQFWKRRYWSFKRRIRKSRWEMIGVQLRLYLVTRRLNILYRPFIQPAFKQLDHYERIYLAQWVHSFEADLESFRLTVVSGRLLEELTSEDCAGVRAFYMLEDLPVEQDRLRAYLKDYLESYDIGFVPNAAVEGLFETWLRVRLLQDDTMRRKWGVSSRWLRHCIPPPGGLGVVQSTYGHFTNNDDWLPNDFSVDIANPNQMKLEIKQ